VKALDGGFYSNHYDPGDTRPMVQDWLKRYGAQYKDNLGNPKVPDAIATLAYDATNMLLTAIQQAGVDDTSKVAQTLAQLHWNGVTGAITFDGYHNPIKSAVIISIQNGQKTYYSTINP
jgi:branched-chain amino acid transport system substrate-binding protein